MSKIPVEKNAHRSSARGIYVNAHSKFRNNMVETSKEFEDVKRVSETLTSLPSKAGIQLNGVKKQFLTTYASLLPKMKDDLEEANKQNPRILDLRLKLDEITKKQDKNVDKETKGLINGITQQLVEEKGQDQSGPYSLLFDLQSSSTSEKDQGCTSTSLWEKSKQGEINIKGTDERVQKSSNDSLNKTVDRVPNVIHMDDKHLKEFEYFCEAEANFPGKKAFHIQSRSDLCLNFKSYSCPRPFEPNLSPNDNSLSRNNEENSLDDSLGILTPDQMDDICYLENAFSPTVEGLPSFCDKNDSKGSSDTGDTPSTDKTESHSAASTIQNDGFGSNDNKVDTDISEASPAPPVEGAVDDKKEQQVLLNSSLKIPQNSKEELLKNLMDDDFMPSIHSSILDPVSSIAETTVNLELPLDCKLNENRLTTQRIEQTPSPEDLPLDSCDIHTEISTYSNSQYSTSILQDSQTFSDTKTDFTKSMETSKVSNSFITSITSITSLDGYQGDGEMSRPVSRGADHSIGAREEVNEMDWQNLPVTRRPDPMTDSDFFTESDADGLDDQMQRGDRRAQVIDGALYGGKNGNGNPPLIVTRSEDSCMESSGVYTDFETNRTSPIFLNIIDDMSPEVSTPSTHSECSQKNVNSGEYNPDLDETIAIKGNFCKIDDEETPTNTSKINSLNSEKDAKFSNKISKDDKKGLKKYKMPKRDVPSKLKSMLAGRKNDNDSSLQSSPKTANKNERRENLLKKNSNEIKKDFIKPKSYKDIKSKVDCSLSLQRSQTTCSVPRMLSSKCPPNNTTKSKSRHLRMRMDLGSAACSGKSSLHSSQSDISASSTPIAKVSGNRFPLLSKNVETGDSRGTTATMRPTTKTRKNGNGKKRDSLVPPAAPTRAPAPPPHPPAPTPAKKNGVVQKLAASPVSVRARTSLAPPPSPRKTTPRRPLPQRPTTLPTSNKEPPKVTAPVGPRGKRVATPPAPARSSPAPLIAPLPTPPVPTREQTAALAHAAKGVEALGVLVQFLMGRVDALNSESWRIEAERWRTVAAAERSNAARADRDRQQRAQKDLDTIAECLSKISELEIEVSNKEEVNARLQASHAEQISPLVDEIKELKETIETIKRELSESRARLHAHSEIERTLRAQLEAARNEIEKSINQSTNTSCDSSYCSSYDKSCVMCDAACDPVSYEAEECEIRLKADEELSSDPNELAAEVRSLRAVVELKQAELASLRGARSELAAEREYRAAAERDARAARHAAEELRERAAARQRDVDRLKDDNRRLRDAANRDRDHANRLTTLNEELRYKLRQKSQVVSLLAGGTYMERGQMRARTASCDSTRSPSPPPDSPPSPASSPAPDTPPLPAVKGVVEKHDSVSWVLEIEETPEEVASRLARKSSFRTASSPSGVKRRGGGSPGGGSPAPASPAPNASKLFRPGDLDFPPPPPPLKESAGEAIYIYDDRQY